MTTSQIREELNALIDAFEIDHNISPSQTLITVESIALTDAIAAHLDTVNPNDRQYPSTPR